MTITINNQQVELSEEFINLAQLLELRNVKAGGTAVALNNKIVRHENWETTTLSEGDSLTIISAAFGG